MPVERFSHVGVCVTDLARSLAFYRDSLGFTEQYRFELPPRLAPIMELDDARGTSVFLERDGFRLELLAFDAPEVTGDGARRAMNQRGITHFGLRVRDFDGTVQALRDAGVNVIEHTRVDLSDPDTGATGSWVFVTDPDGVRVEIMEIIGEFSRSDTDS
jgi:glyoxylase I family protein